MPGSNNNVVESKTVNNDEFLYSCHSVTAKRNLKEIKDAWMETPPNKNNTKLTNKRRGK